MSHAIESPGQARQRRAGSGGRVDFTLMYIAQDALNRDLGRLLAAAEAGRGHSPAAGILDDMEDEHASLDPRLRRVEAALAAGDDGAVAEELTALGRGLADHMRHEEDAALPLLERRLGQAGWDAFGSQVRSQQGGLRGAAAYLPWVLDGADPASASRLLGLLPPPARLLYRGVWEPRYRRAERLR